MPAAPTPSTAPRPSNAGPAKEPYKLADFKVVSELGGGSFGIVQQVVQRETGEVFAMKVLEKRKVVEKDLQEQLKTEVVTQLQSKHPNVVRMLYYFEDSMRVYCLLEYADEGQLFAYLKRQSDKYGTGVSEPRAAAFFSDTAKGIEYLHGIGVVHRDLKPENILLYTEALVAKIGDLGWCAKLTNERPARNTFCGTMDYLAPEMLMSEPHDAAVDLWALGILLFEMLVARPPFVGASQKESVDRICAARAEVPPGSMTEGPAELIQGLLQREKTSRMPIPTVLQHPWVVSLGYSQGPGTHISGATASSDAARAQGSLEATKRTPRDIEDTRRVPQDIEGTRQVPRGAQDVESTRRVPRDVQDTKQVPQDVESTRRVPRDVENTRQAPQEVDSTRRVPREMENTRHVPRDIDDTRQVPQSSIEKTKHVPRPQNSIEKTAHVPRDIENTRAVPKDVDHTRHVPREMDHTKHVPREMDHTKHVPREMDHTKHVPRDMDATRHTPREMDHTKHVPRDVEDKRQSQQDVENTRHVPRGDAAEEEALATRQVVREPAASRGRSPAPEREQASRPRSKSPAVRPRSKSPAPAAGDDGIVDEEEEAVKTDQLGITNADMFARIKQEMDQLNASFRGRIAQQQSRRQSQVDALQNFDPGRRPIEPSPVRTAARMDGQVSPRSVHVSEHSDGDGPDYLGMGLGTADMGDDLDEGSFTPPRDAELLSVVQDSCISLEELDRNPSFSLDGKVTRISGRRSGLRQLEQGPRRPRSRSPVVSRPVKDHASRFDRSREPDRSHEPIATGQFGKSNSDGQGFRSEAFDAATDAYLLEKQRAREAQQFPSASGPFSVSGRQGLSPREQRAMSSNAIPAASSSQKASTASGSPDAGVGGAIVEAGASVWGAFFGVEAKSKEKDKYTASMKNRRCT